MANTLFMVAYAAEVEQLDLSQFPEARTKEDWMKIAPPTPKSAHEAAERIIQRIENLNKTKVEDVYKKCSQQKGHHKPPNPKDFGHYLIMEAIASGHTWSDDHPPHRLRIPYCEVHLKMDPKTEGFEITITGA